MTCLHTYIHTGIPEILSPLLQGTSYFREGQNRRLRCIGVGHPPPLVKWRKLNGSLSDRVFMTNVSVSTNKRNVSRVIVDLIFTNVSRKDTAVYKCTASNQQRNITRNISLIVRCMYAID